MRVGEGSAERAFGELLAESADAVGAIGGVGFHAAEAVKLLDDFVGNIERGVGSGLVPGLRNSGAARVTDAAVVGREGRGDDEGLRNARGYEVPGGDCFPGFVRRFPLENQRRCLVFVFEKVDANRVSATATATCAA